MVCQYPPHGGREGCRPCPDAPARPSAGLEGGGGCHSRRTGRAHSRLRERQVQRGAATHPTLLSLSSSRPRPQLPAPSSSHPSWPRPHLSPGPAWPGPWAAPASCTGPGSLPGTPAWPRRYSKGGLAVETLVSMPRCLGNRKENARCQLRADLGASSAAGRGGCSSPRGGRRGLLARAVGSECPGRSASSLILLRGSWVLET